MFRVHTLIPIINMLFHHFAIASADHTEARDILATCLSSAEIDLTAPSDLAVFYLVSTLHKHNKWALLAEIVHLSCMSSSYIVTRNTAMLALLRQGSRS